MHPSIYGFLEGKLRASVAFLSWRKKSSSQALKNHLSIFSSWGFKNAIPRNFIDHILHP